MANQKSNSRVKRVRCGAFGSAWMAIVLATSAGMADTLELGWSTVDGGGVMFSAGDAYELSGTVAQIDAGVHVGGSLELTGGFWFAHVPGDCNYDAGISLYDFDGHDACLSGPGAPHALECECHDFDDDGDVDLKDFGAFQMRLTSPS